MAEFIIETTDSNFSYTSTQAVNIKFESQTNNKMADTQGFLRKSQKGTRRIKATVKLTISRSDYEDTILPMEVYPGDVNVTFDRVIPNDSNSTQGRFVFERQSITAEREAGSEYEIQIMLTEVLRSD
jgi:hypothetical protein